jgi:PmbA protein
LDNRFAEKLLDLALDGGADEAEVYVSASKSLGVEVKDGKVENLERSDSFGYSVRVFRDRRLGFSYSTDPAGINDVAMHALESARFSEADEFNELPGRATGPEVKIFDAAVASISEKDAIGLALSLELAAFDQDTRIKKTRNAGSSFSNGSVRILNSRGIDASYSSTSCSASIMAVAESGGESQMAWEYASSRFVSEIDFEGIGRNASVKAARLLGARKISPVKGWVLLDPSVVAEFLEVLSSALSAESVQKKKSMLAGKIGEQVISDRINIIDSGLLDGKTGSRPFDAEGVPTSEKIMIGNGILKGFLHNTYTSLKDNTVSTGNAVRGGFTGIPNVGPTNLFISAVSDDFKKDFPGLVSMIDSGIYVTETMGMHTANPISGDYSVGVSGLFIEKGSLAYPVKEVVISGNILDLFSKIVMVGRDVRFYGNIGTPYVLAEKIDISG